MIFWVEKSASSTGCAFALSASLWESFSLSTIACKTTACRERALSIEIKGENKEGPLGIPASIAISPKVQSSSSLPKKNAAAFWMP